MNPGRLLIFIGTALVVAGVLYLFWGKLGIGQLPGDITIKGERYAVHLPLMTCLIISVAISAILWLVRRFL